ncbi:PIG-L family deacetylase [Achromobacter sp. NPDC058515]|uniref:PIG-L family deacetylase n=1 Tax=Achromobacter sp. NPDC058515 TaxID=3346533 RepID=UPI00365AF70E
MLADGILVAISPYYNDAVVSCGGLLAARPGSTVLTVYSGLPLAVGQLSDWDRRCGFVDGRQAMLTRHAQSVQALALLGVQGEQMDLLDDQYLDNGDGGRLTGALAAALSTLRPRIILTPLGLFHAAHVRVCDAAITIRGLFRRVIWLAYEEASDRSRPGAVQERLATLLRRQITATPIAVADAADPRVKQRAIAAFDSLAAGPCGGRSQPWDGAQAERYWRLGWQRDGQR